MRPRRPGLMGLGAIALGRHVPAILETSGLTLHAVREPDEGRRRLATEDLGVPFHREKNFAGMDAEFALILDTGESSLLGAAGDGLRAIGIARRATEEARGRRPRVRDAG